MQEAPEGALAPLGIALGVEDERMPVRVDGLRWHGHVLAVAARTRHEELAKPALDEIGVLRLELRILLAQLALGEHRQAALADRHAAARGDPRGEQAGSDDDQEQGDQPARSKAPPAGDRAGDVGQPAEHREPGEQLGVALGRAKPTSRHAMRALRSRVTRPPARARGGCRTGRRRFPGSRAKASSPPSRWPRRG